MTCKESKLIFSPIKIAGINSGKLNMVIRVKLFLSLAAIADTTVNTVVILIEPITPAAINTGRDSTGFPKNKLKRAILTIANVTIQMLL